MIFLAVLCTTLFLQLSMVVVQIQTQGPLQYS